jgi:hypothetical protein
MYVNFQSRIWNTASRGRSFFQQKIHSSHRHKKLSKDGVQSRTMNTSFANLCLFLNDFGTFNYFSLPMVNHHFLSSHKLNYPVGNASSLLSIMNAESTNDPILPNSVMKNKIVHDRIFSSVVIVFYKFGSGVDSDPLYHCLSG